MLLLSTFLWKCPLNNCVLGRVSDSTQSLSQHQNQQQCLETSVMEKLIWPWMCVCSDIIIIVNCFKSWRTGRSCKVFRGRKRTVCPTVNSWQRNMFLESRHSLQMVVNVLLLTHARGKLEAGGDFYCYFKVTNTHTHTHACTGTRTLQALPLCSPTTTPTTSKVTLVDSSEPLLLFTWPFFWPKQLKHKQ